MGLGCLYNQAKDPTTQAVCGSLLVTKLQNDINNPLGRVPQASRAYISFEQQQQVAHNNNPQQQSANCDDAS